ncbi:MAG TPA: hypothetical protein VE783_07890 [Candidatus Limnocylindrales bacterium]|nr:hypothetical protein [Candidatus Limnocylindrales bacterium]
MQVVALIPALARTAFPADGSTCRLKDYGWEQSTAGFFDFPVAILKDDWMA